MMDHVFVFDGHSTHTVPIPHSSSDIHPSHLISVIQNEFHLNPNTFRIVRHCDGSDISGHLNSATITSCVPPSPPISSGEWMTLLIRQRGGGPKKKKGGGGGKKKKKDDNNGADESSNRLPDLYEVMNKGELHKCREVLSMKLDKMRSKRTYFQIETSHLLNIKKISQKKLKESKAQIKNIESKMDKMRIDHNHLIKTLLQKVKHLEYDHVNSLNAIAMDRDILQNEILYNNIHKHKLNMVQWQRGVLKKELRKIVEQNEKHVNQELLPELESEHSMMQRKFEEKLERLGQSFQSYIRELRDDLDLETSLILQEINERKNLHINDLMNNHDISYFKMKEYYISITQDNLDLITALKSEIAELLNKIHQHESKYNSITVENKKLSIPLDKAQKKVDKLQKQLVNYEKEKRALKSLKNTLINLTDKQTQLNHENTRLIQLLNTSKQDLVNTQNLSKQQLQLLDEQESKKRTEYENRLSQMEQEKERLQIQLDQVVEKGNFDRAEVNHRLQTS